MSHIDPVCGMEVDEGRAPSRMTHRDRIFYFCSLGCHAEFQSDPFRYSSPDPSAWLPQH